MPTGMMLTEMNILATLSNNIMLPEASSWAELLTNIELTEANVTVVFVNVMRTESYT